MAKILAIVVVASITIQGGYFPNLYLILGLVLSILLLFRKEIKVQLPLCLLYLSVVILYMISAILHDFSLLEYAPVFQVMIYPIFYLLLSSIENEEKRYLYLGIIISGIVVAYLGIFAYIGVSRNKRVCFHEKRMQEWTFEHDNGSTPAMNRARAFVEHWDEVRNAKAGLLFWGGIGTGKTYMAACIANALLEKEKRVMMTDFSAITNISVNDAREYISCLVSYDLLIIDDLGAERSTEYAIQNVFDVINRRWESGRPLIVTTNLDMKDITNQTDLAKARIYDRLLDMCTPVFVDGDSKRIESANHKKNFYKGIFKEKKVVKTDERDKK